jgi:ATP-dependent Clp protease ATP-binding subunit ClpC
MLPKSSHRVAEVIKIANQIAREYDQEYVGTEHVLLAIQREGTGIGAKVFEKRGITAERLREEVDKLVKKRLEETWVFGRLPGTPHFKNVVAIAIGQCQQIKAKEVCTEHLLLALLRERGSVAYKALKTLGLGYDDVRADLLELTAKR